MHYIHTIKPIEAPVTPPPQPSTHTSKTQALPSTKQGTPYPIRRSRSSKRQKEPDYLLWLWAIGSYSYGLRDPLRSSFASSSTPAAGCLLQLKHGLDEAARGAKSG
jgi:hypothetical protein